MQEQLSRANAYIAQHSAQVNPRFRQSYHLMPPVGWMNDPNGFIYYEGYYHLFYQFYPYDSVWGPMHWGHARSKDLTHWEDLPVALAPSEAYDQSGCFSGSALVIDGQLVLMYTGHVDQQGQVTQTQCLAVSDDGINFRKYEGNPVIAHKHIEGVADIADFRDPKILQHNGRYYSVIASKTFDHRGQILLFESANGFDWDFKSVLLEGQAGHGVMWECPDLFPLDGKWVLIMSPIERERAGNAYWNLNSTVAYVGQVDWESGRFQVENQHEIDGGLDFYAPQTCLNSENERIMVAWMQMWQRNIPSHELGDGWAGAMSLPRQVRVMDNRLCQSIPSSVLAQFSEGKTWQGQLEPGQEFYLSDWVKSQQVLKLNLEAVPGAVFQLHYGGTSNHPEGLGLTWQADQALLTVKRDGVGHQIIGKEAPYLDSRLLDIWSDTPYRLELEIVRDTSSIEVFVNKKQVMSFTFYAEGLGTGIGLVSSQLVKVENLTNYSLI